MEDAEVVGTLRLPLGGMNGYLNVRGRQGRQKDKYQGFTPNKTRRTKLFDTPREAAVALAAIKQQGEDQFDDPISHIDFASPALTAPAAAALPSSSMPVGRLPLRPQLELRLRVSEAPRMPQVHVGMPMTAAQLSLAHMCNVPFVRAVPCMPAAAVRPALRS